MNTIPFPEAPVVKYSVDLPGDKGESASFVWNLQELKEKNIPFERIDEEKLEHIVQLAGGGDNGPPDSKIWIRLGVQKTHQVSEFINNRAGGRTRNYLSLTATALSTGGREELELLVSVYLLWPNSLTEAIREFSEEAVVRLTRRGDGRHKVILQQFLYHSYYENGVQRKESEYFPNEHYSFGITLTILHPKNEARGRRQPIQQEEKEVSYYCSHDGDVSSSSFSKSLQEMYGSERSYSDVKLETKDFMVLDGHRFILAARSPVLRELLAKQGDDDDDDEGGGAGGRGTLKIDNINGKPMRSILHWMYTNSLEESLDNVLIGEVLEGAKALGLTELLALLDRKLITICNPLNMMHLFAVAFEHKLKTAVEDLRQYIKENIEDPCLKL